MPSLNRLLSDNLPVDPSKNTFTGNGSQTVFNLTGQVAAGSTNPSNLIVVLDGAMQEPTIDYTINNSTLTFTTAPDSGAKVVVISRNSPFTYATNLPGDGTVTSAKIVAGNVTPDKLSAGAPFWNSSSNVALGHSSPATNLHINYSGYGAILFGNNNSTGFHITKESSDNTFNIWSGTIGSGTNRFRIMPSGNVGIGSVDAESVLHIKGQNTGSTEGNKSNSLILQGSNSNASFLEINDYRVSNGLNWETAGFRIQQRTDVTWQSYIQFNGNNSHGISIGTGFSNTNGHSVPERIRITETGTIDVKNNPIINCTSTAAAWVRFSGIDGFWTTTIAPNTQSLKPYAGQNRVDWQIPQNGWWDLYLGVVYYINVSNTYAPLGGVASVTRPNGLQGVRIRVVEIIQNAPISIARCEFLDGIPSNSNIVTGTGNSSGFSYIASPIYESYNVSSVIRHGTGDFTINFITPMPNRNYAIIGNAGMDTATYAAVVTPDMTNVGTAATPNIAYYQRRQTNSARFTVRRAYGNGVFQTYTVDVAIFAASTQDNV